MNALYTLLLIIAIIAVTLILYYSERLNIWLINDLRYKVGNLKWAIGVCIFIFLFAVVIWLVSR